MLIFAATAWMSPAREPGRPLEFADVFPIGVLEPLFFVVSGFVILAFAIGLIRFVRASRPPGGARAILTGLRPALSEIATHHRFAECGAERNRRLGHLLTFYGFLDLAFVGTSVGIGTMAGVMSTPLALLSFWKVFADICALIILTGSSLILWGRLKNKTKRRDSTWFDWYFLSTLFAAVVTGIMSELLRLWQWYVMYYAYYAHLVLIFSLFLYAPYSKFAHLAYRTVAQAMAGNRAMGKATAEP